MLTPSDLAIYRLRIRVAVLERLVCSVSIGLLTQAGVPLQEARLLLLDSIERGKNHVAQGIPNYSDPAQQAQAHDEFQEIVDSVKALVRSYE